jgi:hypothetical protein
MQGYELEGFSVQIRDGKSMASIGATNWQTAGGKATHLASEMEFPEIREFVRCQLDEVVQDGRADG